MTENKESYPHSFCTLTWWLELQASLPRNPWRKWPVLACWPQVTSSHWPAFFPLCFPKLRCPPGPMLSVHPVITETLSCSWYYPTPPRGGNQFHGPGPLWNCPSGTHDPAERLPVFWTHPSIPLPPSGLCLIVLLLVPVVFLLPPFYLLEALLSYRNNLALGPRFAGMGSWAVSGILWMPPASSSVRDCRLQEEREGPFQSFQWGKERSLNFALDVFSQISKIEHTSLWCFFPSNNSWLGSICSSSCLRVWLFSWAFGVLTLSYDYHLFLITPEQTKYKV